VRGFDAIFSPCRTWRYTLPRPCTILAPKHPPLVFGLLNPSKADTDSDDPTSTRTIGYAAREECDGSIIVNAYGLCATDPRELWKHHDPIGPKNDEHIERVLSASPRCVVGWGRHARHDRVRRFVAIARAARCELFCLGINDGGSPKHPLYLRKDAPLVRWEMPA
jgi:hypothetical protein